MPGIQMMPLTTVLLLIWYSTRRAPWCVKWYEFLKQHAQFLQKYYYSVSLGVYVCPRLSFSIKVFVVVAVVVVVAIVLGAVVAVVVIALRRYNIPSSHYYLDSSLFRWRFRMSQQTS